MSKYSIIFNTIDRFDITTKVMEQNIKNSMVNRGDIEILITDNGSTDDRIKEWAMDFGDVVTLNEENKGNAYALNRMMEVVSGDYVALLGNDLAMYPGWLQGATEAINKLRDAGLIGFHWGLPKLESFPGSAKVYDDIRCHQATLENRMKIFGSWFYKRDLWERVGYFNELSKYGLWDTHYGVRTLMAGYKNYYLDALPSRHVGVGDHDAGEYRQLKDRELKKAHAAGRDLLGRYSPTCFHVNKNQQLIR